MSRIATLPAGWKRDEKLYCVTGEQIRAGGVVLCSHHLPLAESWVDCATGELLEMRAIFGSWFEIRQRGPEGGKGDRKPAGTSDE